MWRTTERLIQLLETVNPTAVNNDDGKPGECRPSWQGGARWLDHTRPGPHARRSAAMRLGLQQVQQQPAGWAGRGKAGTKKEPRIAPFCDHVRKRQLGT